jgi:hypothetical protein
MGGDARSRRARDRLRSPSPTPSSQASRSSCCKPLHYGHNFVQSLDEQVQVFAEVDLLLTALHPAVGGAC